MLKYKPDWERWHASGFGRELLPIIPIDATIAKNSNVIEANRGKVPGIRKADGTWVGLGGKWSDELFPKAQTHLMPWKEMGAGIGAQCRTFTFSDIDVSHKETAESIVALAFEHMGPTSIRWRSNSAKVALIYHCPGLRKRRIAFRIPGVDDVQAVEQLGKGQYANVDGMHPSNVRYKWSGDAHPLQLKAAGITKITPEQVDKFFAAVGDYLDMMDYEIVKSSGGGYSTSGPRMSLDNPSLHAPTPERVLEVLQAVPCNETTLPSRDDLIEVLSAIRGSLRKAGDDYWHVVLDWLLHYPGADEAYHTKIWRSFDRGVSLGWSYLEKWGRGKGYTEGAQYDFADDSPQPVSANAENSPRPDNGMPAQTAIEKALQRYIWCSSTGDFYDTETHTHLSKDAFNTVNTDVADYGRPGTQSAVALWMNSEGARKVNTTTYRIGEPLVVQEGPALALNLWRPNTSFTPATNVSEEDVKPWLDHMQLIFGPPDGPAMQHVLNWMAFAVQRPGVKINHALVIYGATQGTGKDTCFVPLVRFFGDNVQNLQPEALTGQFNGFLCSQICIVNEMINFEKKATMNRMKPFLAVPPYTITINRKFEQPFSIPNVVNWVIYTNYPDAISMDETDRRFFVHECCLRSPMPKEYYEKLYAFYKAGGAEKVIGWLSQRNISLFNSFAPPPVTEAKRDMIKATLPRAVQWLLTFLVDEGPYADRRLMLVPELELKAAVRGAPPGISHKSAASALRAAGFEPLPKMKIDGSNRTVWVRDPSKLLSQMSSDEIRKRYELECSGSSMGQAAGW